MQLRRLQDPASVKTNECCDKAEESQSGGKHHQCLEPHWQHSLHVDNVGKKKKVFEVKRKVVFKVVNYLEEVMACKSEMLKQFYAVVHIQWICQIAKNTASSDWMVQAMN